MTDKNVTNNHDAPLGVGGVQIRPGATVRVKNWEVVERSNAVKAWVDAGVLSVAAASSPPALLPGMTPIPEAAETEEQERERIIAELAALGVTTNATKIETLRKKLAEAKG